MTATLHELPAIQPEAVPSDLASILTGMGYSPEDAPALASVLDRPRSAAPVEQAMGLALVAAVQEASPVPSVFRSCAP